MKQFTSSNYIHKKLDLSILNMKFELESLINFSVYLLALRTLIYVIHW